MLENINLEDIINAYEKIFFKEARKLEIHVISDNLCEDNQKMKIDRMQKEMNIIEIKSINNWKMQADSHQDYYALK